MIVVSRGRYEETFWVALSGYACRGDQLVIRHCYESVSYFIEHGYSNLSSSLFQSLPFEVLEHIGDARSSAVSAGHETCCSSLHHFKSMFMVLLVWVPDCT